MLNAVPPEEGCHHCHMTSPIPLGELFKTHPLRQQPQKEDPQKKNNPQKKVNPQKDNSQKKVNPQTSSPQNVEKLPAITEAIVHHNKTSPSFEFSSKNADKKGSTSNKSESAKAQVDRNTTNSKTNRPDVKTSSISRKLTPEPGSKTGTLKRTFAFVRAPTTSFLHRFTKSTLYRNKYLCQSNDVSSNSKINVQDLFQPNNVSDSKPQEAINEKVSGGADRKFETVYQALSRVNKSSEILSKFRDSTTQTSVSRSFFRQYYPTLSVSSKTKLVKKERKKHKQKYLCWSLPSSLLIAGYILLIAITVILAVALGQRERRLRGQAVSAPRRPTSFPGATLTHSILAPTLGTPALTSPNLSRNRHRLSIKRPTPSPDRRRILTKGPKIQSPSRNLATEQTSNQVPPAHFATVLSSSPPLVSVPVPKPSASSQSFRDEDLDYFINNFDNFPFDDSTFTLSDKNAEQEQASQNIASLQPLSPLSLARPAPIPPPRRVATQAPSPAQDVQSVARAPVQQIISRNPAPRRGLNNNFKQEFKLDPKPSQPKTNVQRGQRQPAVQIVKSWSNRNADGTFSWGYINSDGSFKNETKGADCVVRGVYGYIDKDTGETLSFPYATGNPCDPNSPDYFYDYDTGTLNVAGQPVKPANNLNQLKSQRRLVQVR